MCRLGDWIWVKAPHSQSTSRYQVGHVTNSVSPQIMMIDGIAQHVKDLCSFIDLACQHVTPTMNYCLIVNKQLNSVNPINLWIQISRKLIQIHLMIPREITHQYTSWRLSHYDKRPELTDPPQLVTFMIGWEEGNVKENSQNKWQRVMCVICEKKKKGACMTSPFI